ncbi:MAG: tetratricopeptide repeat protein [Acidobacteriota bacterium]|nr:tetratricopeptide repeat protein [Acidobacteriota bacterium]
MKACLVLVVLGLAGFGSIAAQSNGGSKTQQVQMHEQRAHEFLTEKRPELAAKEFAAILAIDPKNLNAQGNLGVLLYFQNDYAGAEPHLRNAVDQQPALTKIRTLLAMCERHLGKTDAARTDLEAVVTQLKDPKLRLEAGLELIELYSASDDLAQAARIVAILREGAPTDARILYVAYRIYSDLAAEALLDMSIAAPNSGQMHQAMAHELGRAGDLTGAIADYRIALATDPRLPGIHFELAEALHNSPEKKVKDGAEQEYRLAVESNPLDEKALSRLGDVVAEKGNLDEAEKDYRQALVIAPGDVDAKVGLAFVASQKNDPAAALPLLESVVAADPGSILAHYRLSMVYRSLHRPEEAKRQIEEYKKYKDLKEKLRTVYKDMKVDTPPAASDQ